MFFVEIIIIFAQEMNKTDHQILNIALPAIVANITVPLLGLIDSAIVGHMGAAAYIGAVAVGSMIFNLVYWVFGFLGFCGSCQSVGTFSDGVIDSGFSADFIAMAPLRTDDGIDRSDS